MLDQRNTSKPRARRRANDQWRNFHKCVSIHDRRAKRGLSPLPFLFAKLKWFQYRIFYRVLTTNRYKRKVIDSDRSTICKTEKESISHLLWDCTYTETFWKPVLECITKNTPHVRFLNITEQLVTLGVKDDVTTDKVLDLIMLVAKYYIFRCKCLKTSLHPNFTSFSKEVRQKSS